MNDVHFLDLNDPNNPCWYKMTIDDSNEMVPAPRWRHTATAISESEMLVRESVLFIGLLSVHCLHICVANSCFRAHSLRTKKCCKLFGKGPQRSDASSPCGWLELEIDDW
jgi:hypothetical protein